MTGRIVHAIRIHFGGLSDQSIIIWPNRLPELPCARLLNSRKNWLTAGRDDIVMLTTDQQHWQKMFITQIELYRASPAEHNGEIVETAQAWTDGEGTAK